MSDKDKKINYLFVIMNEAKKDLQKHLYNLTREQAIKKAGNIVKEYRELGEDVRVEFFPLLHEDCMVAEWVPEKRKLFVGKYMTPEEYANTL